MNDDIYVWYVNLANVDLIDIRETFDLIDIDETFDLIDIHETSDLIDIRETVDLIDIHETFVLCVGSTLLVLTSCPDNVHTGANIIWHLGGACDSIVD